MIISYAAGSTFEGIGNPPSLELGLTAVVSLKQNKGHIQLLGKFKASPSGVSWKSGLSSKESLDSEITRGCFLLLELQVCKCRDLKSDFGCDCIGNSKH